jgi:hypothetical protein
LVAEALKGIIGHSREEILLAMTYYARVIT